MPLLWTHSEFLKLLLAREAKKPAELLRVVAERYAHSVPGETPVTLPLSAQVRHWRPAAPVAQLEPGLLLLVEGTEGFTLHCGFDGHQDGNWQDAHDREALPLPFGLWGVAFSPAELHGHTTLEFTRRTATGWEGQNHVVRLSSTAEQGLVHQDRPPQEQA